MNFNRLHYFYVTASEGSMTRAAARLGVTTPTVSEQIRRLELDHDAELFGRRGGGVELTRAGRDLFEKAAAMFRVGEQVFTEAQNGTALVVRAGVCARVGSLAGADFFEPFFADAEVRCVVEHLPPVELERSVASGELNMALSTEVPNAGDERGLEHRLLREIPMALTGPVNAPWPPEEPLPFVAYRRSSRLHSQCDAWLRSQSIEVLTLGEVDDPQIQLRLVERRSSWCIVPVTHLKSSEMVEKVRMPFTAEIYGIVQDRNLSEHVGRLLDGLARGELTKSK